MGMYESSIWQYVGNKISTITIQNRLTQSFEKYRKPQNICMQKSLKALFILWQAGILSLKFLLNLTSFVSLSYFLFWKRSQAFFQIKIKCYKFYAFFKYFFLNVCADEGVSF